ncbi:MAG: AAA+ family ATPase [Cypionkella sp.]
MKQLILAISLLAAPLSAQTVAPPVTPPASDVDEGFSLLQEGAKLLLRGMASQMEPAMKDMAEAMEKAAPQLQAILAMIDDVKNYEPPTRLPNGDILIRRKLGAPPVPALPDPAKPDPAKPGETEL